MRPTRSSSIVAIATLALAGALILPDAAHAAPRTSVSILPIAQVDTAGAVHFRVAVRCGPLPGTPDVRQSNASASQWRGGAGEGGLSPDVVCDGVRRIYTASVSSTNGKAFRRGLASAHAAVNVCNAVGNGQVCTQGSARGVLVILGRPGPAGPPPPPPPPPEPTVDS